MLLRKEFLAGIAAGDITLAFRRWRRPKVRAGDLCDLVGQEKVRFKLNERKLKGLGLTESLGTGYRLSPRGRALLGRKA